MATVNEIAEKYLWCRDVMHAWDDYTAQVRTSKLTRRKEMHQVLVCTRCGTLKTRVMSLAGELLRNSYTYPGGYLLTEQGRMSPADRAMIRKINFSRSREITETSGTEL